MINMMEPFTCLGSAWIISKLIEHWKGNRINNDESFGDFYNNQDFEKIKQLVQ